MTKSRSPSVDVASGHEVDALEDALDARAHVDGGERDRVARELDVRGHLLLDGLAHRHLGWRWWRVLVAAAGGEHGRREHGGEASNVRYHGRHRHNPPSALPAASIFSVRSSVSSMPPHQVRARISSLVSTAHEIVLSAQLPAAAERLVERDHLERDAALATIASESSSRSFDCCVLRTRV